VKVKPGGRVAFVFAQNEWQLRARDQQIPLSSLVRDQRAPFYLYNFDDLIDRVNALEKNPVRTHYAMKANSHPRLLRLLAERGLGVDVVSLGELQKALSHGFQPQHVIFSGVAKGVEELQAALDNKIFQINVESFEELQTLAALAKAQSQIADVALRLNIGLTAPTHKHIQTATETSKFGIDMSVLPEVLQWLKLHPEIRLRGIAVHIGSQILDVSAFADMSEQTGLIYNEIKAEGFPLERMDLGGGLGIDYQTTGEGDQTLLDAYMKALCENHKTSAQILIEPGRYLVARSGVLLARVIYVKSTPKRRFMILNTGMNALMRPALYEAYHRIEPLVPRSSRETYTVVGPICESTDMFAEDRILPQVATGDWIGIFDAGAYGAVMANTYNETPLPAQWSYFDGKLEVL